VRLDQAGLSDWADTLFADKPLELARQAAERGINAPMSSSAGRLFDAVAAVLGICPDRQSFEGEAAMRLEALAEPCADCFDPSMADGEIDPAPVFHALRNAVNIGLPVGGASARFHVGLARAFADQARVLLNSGEAQAVALSGGCFQNALLLSETVKRLGDAPVLIHKTTPANDGGLALGQALVAAAGAATL